MTRPSTDAKRAANALRPLDLARRSALERSRNVVRLSAALIRGLHRGASEAAIARSLEREATALHRVVSHQSFLATHGAIQQAFGEYAEAHLLREYLRGGGAGATLRLPDLPGGAYLLGLSDVAGELRRVVLARLLQDDLAGAEDAFGAMEKAYESLVDVEVPEGILAIRAKVDALRSLVERTRGDLLMAKKNKRLENKIDGVSALLDEAEGKASKARDKKDKEDLDLDAAWNKG